MRVVVTGAAGFIGSHVCRALLDAGHGVVGLDAFTASYDPAIKRRNARELSARSGCTLVAGPAERTASAPACRDADALVHLAAMPGVRSGDARALHAANVEVTHSVLERAAHAGVRRVVLASSSSVYAPAPGPLDEGAKLGPLSSYGHSKLSGERVAHLCARACGLELVVLRYFTVYGPRQRPDMAFAQAIAAARNGSAVTLFGDGSQRRDWTYAGDAASATVAALERGRSGATYNVAGGRPTTLHDALELLAAHLGVRARLDVHPPDPREARQTAADTGRARLELGWAPSVELADGLAAQVAYGADPERSDG
jgi:nucleoside-diphosphate-sugar epimerase